jgi:hypothetical protein
MRADLREEVPHAQFDQENRGRGTTALGVATAVASTPTPAEVRWHGGGFHGGGFHGGGWGGGFHGGWGGGVHGEWGRPGWGGGWHGGWGGRGWGWRRATRSRQMAAEIGGQAQEERQGYVVSQREGLIEQLGRGFIRRK